MDADADADGGADAAEIDGVADGAGACVLELFWQPSRPAHRTTKAREVFTGESVVKTLGSCTLERSSRSFSRPTSATLERSMYETKAHTDANYLYICIKGLMYLPEAEEAVAAVIAEGKKLRPGFAIINDISEARPTSPEIAEVIKKAQVALFGMGAVRVIRIVNSAGAATHLQFARTQRESNAAYESHIAASLDDALSLLREA
jgi:hypothetical protein